MRGLRSFRSRIVAIVLMVGVLPLGLIGLWLTGATGRSGEALLRDRLEQTLDETVARIGASWIAHRSELLDLAAAAAVADALRTDGPAAAPAAVEAWLAGSQPAVTRLILRDAEGTVRWQAATPDAASAPAAQPPIPLRVELYDGLAGPLLGDLVADLRAAGLVAGTGQTPTGTVLGAFDPASGAALMPLPFDPHLLAADRFALGRDEWLATRRTFADPPVMLVAAAPLSPFRRPFARSARQGALLLAVVAGLGLGAAWLLTTRLTRSLERLAGAAEAVTRGELDRRVAEVGSAEVERVAAAFNSMTASLQRTLAELADRRALAALGEFAASLAHEIRNPLTSIQVDLQLVEERLDRDDETARAIQARALAEVRRLDRTVGSALVTARSGRLGSDMVDLPAVLDAAIHAAGPAMAAGGARLTPLPTGATDLAVPGDAHALEQLFLNLLLNAAAAVAPGGSIAVRADREDDAVVVTIRADGHGIPGDALPRVFEPLYTTRPRGAGLGLPIARRLAEAHGGQLSLESEPGRGTAVRVRLPAPLADRVS
jgi:signal transduction histidine kinase